MLDQALVNWPLKLLSLALAFAVWVFVTGEKRIVQDFSVPLDIRLPDTRVLATAPPTNVTVRLRGPESLMRRFDPVSMGMRVELEDLTAGEQDVQLSRTELNGVPRGVEVEFIDPDRLTLVADVRARRELPVEPTFLGSPPEGYWFYGVQVIPDKVMVEGPQSEVSTLKVVGTNPVRLDQRTAPFVAQVRMVAGSSNVRLVDPRPAELRVEVDASPTQRTFEDIGVELVGQSYETVVSPATLNVTLSGPPELVERIVPGQVRLVADVTGLPPSSEAQAVPVQFDLVDVPIEEMTRVSLKAISRRKIAVRVSERRINL